MFSKFSKKPLVSTDVVINATLPEQVIQVPLTIEVKPTPAPRRQMSASTKRILWIVAAIVFFMAWTIAILFLTGAARLVPVS